MYTRIAAWKKMCAPHVNLWMNYLTQVRFAGEEWWVGGDFTVVLHDGLIFLGYSAFDIIGTVFKVAQVHIIFTFLAFLQLVLSPPPPPLPLRIMRWQRPSSWNILRYRQMELNGIKNALNCSRLLLISFSSSLIAYWLHSYEDSRWSCDQGSPFLETLKSHLGLTPFHLHVTEVPPSFTLQLQLSALMARLCEVPSDLK